MQEEPGILMAANGTYKTAWSLTTPLSQGSSFQKGPQSNALTSPLLARQEHPGKDLTAQSTPSRSSVQRTFLMAF